MHAPLRTALSIVALQAAAPIGVAQETAPSPSPAQVLGSRIETLRRASGVCSTVVIATDGDAYLRAIRAWTPTQRFPVLIDDGSDAARDDIARFVRAFEPEGVVVLDGGSEAAPGGSLAGRASDAVRAAWGVASEKELDGSWAKSGWRPPGLVVACEDDPAWPGAVALAAGRGQRLAWVDPPRGGVDAAWSAELASAFEGMIVGALDAGKDEWRALGDDIDAVTLCLNVPTKVGDPKKPLALTDVIGRHASGARYAWCGQVFGDEAASAYRAMCALFLPPRSAWVFDGYKADFAPPYAGERGADVLRNAGFEVTSDGGGNGRADTWRRRAASATSGAFTPGLIHVNSSGHAAWFTTVSGRGRTGDVPRLSTPALVHFIHSFSAQNPGNGATIAGRWLTSGAYAYVGSVDEPTLGAFFPIEHIAGRMLGGFPLGAAIRANDPSAKQWKIALVGDPLITMPVEGPPRREGVELAGTRPLKEIADDALRGLRLAEALRVLAMLGRDADAARLVRGIITRDGGLIADPSVALQALPHALHAGDGELLGLVYQSLAREDAEAAPNRDALWQAGALHLGGEAPEALVQALRVQVRTRHALHDADALRPHLTRLYGTELAQSVYLELAERVKDEKTASKLRERAAR